MTLVDINLLFYAYSNESPHHQEAKRWLNEQLNSDLRFGMPWSTILGFMRLACNPSVVDYPLSSLEAWRVVRIWLKQPMVWIPTPGEQHALIFEHLLRDCFISPKLVHDAHLAALAIEHGLILRSTDGDFARFEGLRWENPLAKPGHLGERKVRYRSKAGPKHPTS